MAATSTLPPDDMKQLSAQANEAGEKFVKLFYETYDKRRHILNKLYLDTATMVWNGTAVGGIADIGNFLVALPSSEHTTESFDAQPIPSRATQGHTTILVAASGTVKYTGNPIQTFTQNITLTSVDNKWKIVSDNVRTTT